MQGELEAGLQQTSFQQCVQSEQATRDEIKKSWSTFSASDKSHCVALAKTGGESSYTELLTCMEMARDVRKLHEDQQKKDLIPRPPPSQRGFRHRWVIASRRRNSLLVARRREDCEAGDPVIAEDAEDGRVELRPPF
jgi:hypothetical protein